MKLWETAFELALAITLVLIIAPFVAFFALAISYWWWQIVKIFLGIAGYQ